MHSDVTRELDTSCILNVPASKKFSAGRDDSGAMASNLESGRPAFSAFFTKQQAIYYMSNKPYVRKFLVNSKNDSIVTAPPKN